MKGIFAVVAAVASTAVAQGVTDVITPPGSAPGGCASSTDGQFTITVLSASSGAGKRSLETRQQAGVLTLTLKDGILKDQAGRTAYIADNYQFQFDAPPQAGALTTAGYSLCSNGSIALGPTTVFWQCRSGEIQNLYDRYWAEQCVPVHLNRREGGNSVVSQLPDGQVHPTGVPPVNQIPDGQPQGPTGAPVSQIPDGQPQAPTGAPVTQIYDGQPQAPTPKPVTQIADGQPQAPNATSPRPTVLYTGAAAYATPFLGAFAAGVVGAVALL